MKLPHVTGDVEVQACATQLSANRSVISATFKSLAFVYEVSLCVYINHSNTDRAVGSAIKAGEVNFVAVWNITARGLDKESAAASSATGRADGDQQQEEQTEALWMP
eukprot:3821345-Amphidinium_carterae.1